MFLYPSPLHYRVVPQVIYGINATILFGTDTFLTGYAKYAHPYDFYSLRYVFSGAEKLRDDTLTTWLHKFGVRIFDGYGATETSPVLATNTPMQNRLHTVGRFLPGIRYQINPVPGINMGGMLLVLVTTCEIANRAELVRFAKQNQLSELSIPKQIVVWEEIPLLGTGKTDYNRIKELLLSTD